MIGIVDARFGFDPSIVVDRHVRRSDQAYNDVTVDCRAYRLDVQNNRIAFADLILIWVA